MFKSNTVLVIVSGQSFSLVNSFQVLPPQSYMHSCLPANDRIPVSLVETFMHRALRN